MSTTSEVPGLTVKRIPDLEEPVPAVAWPTVGLLAFGIAVWVGSSAAMIIGLWPWWISTMINAFASYLLFTVAHDAGHHSASSDSRLNRWMGRLAVPLFAPHASFPTWRFIHMQHHRFTNHDDGSDPDHYTMRGPEVAGPAALDHDRPLVHGLLPPQARPRPRKEQIEQGGPDAVARRHDRGHRHRAPRGGAGGPLRALPPEHPVPRAGPSTTCPTTGCTTSPRRTS